MKKSAFTVFSFLFVAMASMAITIENYNPKMDENPVEEARAEHSPEILNWESTSYDFETIEQGVSVSYLFKFQNEGTEPLIITKVKPSCGCTATDYPQEPVQP